MLVLLLSGSSLDCDDEAGRSLVQCTLGSPGEIPELNVCIYFDRSTTMQIIFY